MFTFANPFLLWAFPILILPWIFRRRQEERIQKIEFPLIRFLMESEEKDLINPRLQELLLLILRTILLLLLLLALAGPKWNENDSISHRMLSFLPVGTSVQSSVVIIDSSYSMGYGQGESSWWKHSSQVAEQINRELAEFNTTWIWWNQKSFNTSTANQIPTISYSDVQNNFESLPIQTGTSIGELITALSAQIENQERLILISDGQRKPWEPLLETNLTLQNKIPMTVITVGDNSAQNFWIETSEIIPPPWGIAISESVSGTVNGLNVNQNVSLSVYERESGKSIYNQPVNFSSSNDGIVNSRFQFNIDFHDLLNNPNINVQNETVTLMLELNQQDLLPIDNRIELQLPIAKEMQLGIAYETALPPDELRFITSAFLDRVTIVPFSIPEIAYPEDLNLTVLANHFVSGWSSTDTMNTLDYLKNGGNLLIFSDANGNNAWNNLMEEVGWVWNNNADHNEFKNVSAAGGVGMPEELRAWNLNMWDAWKPAVHGRNNATNTRPVITYQSGENEYQLISETKVGKGTIWIVNANLQSSGNAVWSPILPSILWESAKESIRLQTDFQYKPPIPNWESDLTILSDDEKTLLQDRFGIQFSSPENAARELRTVYGGLDLRYLLILLTIFTALVESWLSNRLASL